MTTSLLPIVESTTFDADRSSARTTQIHALVLSESQHIDAPTLRESILPIWSCCSPRTTIASSTDGSESPGELSRLHESLRACLQIA